MSLKIRARLPRQLVEILKGLDEDDDLKKDCMLVTHTTNFNEGIIDKDDFTSYLRRALHSQVSNFLTTYFEDVCELLLSSKIQYEGVDLIEENLVKVSSLEKALEPEDGDEIQIVLDEVEEDNYRNDGQYLNEMSMMVGAVSSARRDSLYRKLIASEDSLRREAIDLCESLSDHGAVSFDYEALCDEFMGRELYSDKSFRINIYTLDDFVETRRWERTQNDETLWRDMISDEHVEWGEVEREIETLSYDTGDAFLSVNNDEEIYVGKRIPEMVDFEDEVYVISFYTVGPKGER